MSPLVKPPLGVGKGLGFWGTTFSAIVATVVGGLILGVLLLFFPSTDAAVWVKAAAVRVGSGIWTALAFSVSVPVVALVAVALLWAWSLRTLRRKGTEPVTPALSPEMLKVDELSIMKSLGTMEGNRLYVEVAGEVLGIGRLELDRAVEKLNRCDLVMIEPNFRGPTLRLTGQGRDFILDHEIRGNAELRDTLDKATREKVDGVRYISQEEGDKIKDAWLRRGGRTHADLDDVSEDALLFVSLNEGAVPAEVAADLHIGEQLALHHLEELKAAELVWDNYTAGSDYGDPSRHEWVVTATGRAHLARRGLLK